MPNKPIEELKSMVGTSRVTVEGLTIEKGKVEEFARALRDENPIHRSESAAKENGLETIPAPLTFSWIYRFPRYCPEELRGEKRRGFDMGFDSSRSIHGEQEYIYERPPFVGETLTGTTTLTDVFQKEGERGGLMTFSVLETEYRNQDDELVLTARKTRIEASGLGDDPAEGDKS